jgi:hypothetical protein
MLSHLVIIEAQNVMGGHAKVIRCVHQLVVSWVVFVQDIIAQICPVF